MAVWLDLSQRLEAGLYQDERFEVGAIYRNSPLPGWLREPWKQAQEDAQCSHVFGAGFTRRQTTVRVSVRCVATPLRDQGADLAVVAGAPRFT